MALLHTAEYRYFVRIEVTPHTRSLSNFSEFTYTVLQAGSISEKSCAQIVATPALLWAPEKKVDTSIAMSPCRHADAPDNYHWCDFNTGRVRVQYSEVPGIPYDSGVLINDYLSRK